MLTRALWLVTGWGYAPEGCVSAATRLGLTAGRPDLIGEHAGIRTGARLPHRSSQSRDLRDRHILGSMAFPPHICNIPSRPEAS